MIKRGFAIIQIKNYTRSGIPSLMAFFIKHNRNYIEGKGSFFDRILNKISDD